MKLSSPAKTAQIVKKYGFRFSKSLGQNFLIDEGTIEKIIDGAHIGPEDNVLEIGPGIGTLTSEMAQRSKKIVAVEIDKSLIPILEETMGEYENFSLVNEDILKTDLTELIYDKFGGERFKVVANLPYYITTPIVMRFLEENTPVSDIVVMVQKEVADRMNAGPSTKDYGALSIAVQFYCETEIIAKVPRHMFMPQPNVDSTVIALRVRDKRKYEVKDEKLFFELVRASFNKRRKTLLNSLIGVRGLNKDELKVILAAAGLDERLRGEALSLEYFARLCDCALETIDNRQ